MDCGFSFIRQKKLTAGFSDFVAFYQLLTGQTNRRYLLKEKGISRPTLSVKFKVFFDYPLRPEKVWSALPPLLSGNCDTKINRSTNGKRNKAEPWVLGLDGKWLKRGGVIMIYRNITRKENLFWSFWNSESYLALKTDLEKLTGLLEKGENGARQKTLPSGIISD